jgi:tRNA modification GTPase
VETIAAIATPGGHGGIGIIRISGLQAKPILNRLFHASGRKRHAEGAGQAAALRSHRMYHGHIKDPFNGMSVDEVMAVVMEAPRSYTREDVVEIQCHGGPAILEKILELVIGQGARLAEAGEYTRRAFMNGRIDLSQAEAVADVINAQSQGAIQIASRQLGGELRRRVERLIARATDFAAEIEAGIEFPEDLESEADRRKLAQQLEGELLPDLERLIASYRLGHLVRDGLQVVIAGRPNVGKSSLMNRLIEKDKAIVTPIAGTTRDLVEDSFRLNGYNVHLSDTAGLHPSSDPVEIVGIRKARERLSAADLVLLMVEANDPFTAEDGVILGMVAKQKAILVINKMDLVAAGTRIDPPGNFGKLPAVCISALDGTGVGRLKGAIAAHGLGAVDRHAQDAVVSNLRHKRCLEGALGALHKAGQGLISGLFDDMIAMELQEAIKELKKITGEDIGEAVLGAIFEKFCIGK